MLPNIGKMVNIRQFGLKRYTIPLDDGMLTFSDVLGFGELVESEMLKHELTIQEVCRSVQTKYPEVYKRH